VLDGIEETGVCAPLLGRALLDDSEDVRDAAFSVLDDKLPEEQNVVFAETIVSPHKDVRAQTVDMISFNPSHQAFEILIRGLNDSDPEIVDEVKWTLDYFVSEEFESYDQAVAWWEQNKQRFDEELFEN
jgi:HEAT repeat protein